MKADSVLPRKPEDDSLIDGSIGEESPFHRTFGYYVHGVGGEETAVLMPDDSDVYLRLAQYTGDCTTSDHAEEIF